MVSTKNPWPSRLAKIALVRVARLEKSFAYGFCRKGNGKAVAVATIYYCEHSEKTKLKLRMRTGCRKHIKRHLGKMHPCTRQPHFLPVVKHISDLKCWLVKIFQKLVTADVGEESFEAVGA